MNFGEKLTSLRKQKGLSQEELGEKLNVTRQTISKWELGQTNPDAGKLTEIANYFNVGVNELTNEEEIQYNDYSSDYDESQKKSGVFVVLVIILIGVLFAIAFLTTKNILKKKQEREEKEKSRIEQINKEKEKFDQRYEENQQFIKDMINNNNPEITYNEENGSTRTKEEIQKEIDELEEQKIQLQVQRDEELRTNHQFTEEWYRLNNEILKIQSQISQLNMELWKAGN